MHPLPVEASDKLPLLASVIWGTIQREQDADSFRPSEEPPWADADHTPTRQ